MASRCVGLGHPKLLQRLPYLVRRLNSAPSTTPSITTVPPLNFEEKSLDTAGFNNPITTAITSADASDKIINFEDVKGLFSRVSTSKLLKSYVTLQMTAIDTLVDVGMWFMNSRLIETPILKESTFAAIRHTFYEHFCGSKDLKEAGMTITRLWEDGLRAMLDYGLEHANDYESCDKNLMEFIKIVESTKTLPPSSVSFVVMKITAICPPSLLRRVSDLLRWEYKDPSFHLPWKLNTLPIFSDSSPFYHTPKKPEPLSPEEEKNLQLSYQRLSKICEKCIEADVPLLIDAEDTTIQPAIDYLTYSSAIRYRKDDEAIVFGTIQTYLKDATERLVRAKKAADRLGVPVGFKLVRGAYLSYERKLAASLGVDSPIHNNIQDTHACYNNSAAFMLEEVAGGSGAVVLASHNVESGKLAAARAIDLGIRKDNRQLQFAQLYGMAESLSLGLRNAGFQVSKYLPFGPVEQIIPYLLRRAEENRGLLSSSYFDRQLMRLELIRRLVPSFVEQKETKIKALN